MEDQRKYPVLLHRTEVKVVWVEADCPENALKDMEDDYEPGTWNNAETVSDLCSQYAALPDESEYLDVILYDSELGPASFCPTCGETWSTGPNTAHDFLCPDGTQAAHRKKYGQTPPDRVQRIRDLYTPLVGTGALQSLDASWDIIFTIRPRTLDEWQAWLTLTGADPTTVRQLRTYTSATGELGSKDLRNSVRTALIGLGVPQLLAADQAAKAVAAQ